MKPRRIPSAHAARQSQSHPERRSRAATVSRARRRHISSALGDQAGQPVTLQVVTNAGTPAESSAQAVVTPLVRSPSLIPLQGCTQVGLCGLGGGAIHHDWSSYVTSDSPALPGEVLHFYGTGFGPVQPAVATGTPAPASPLAVVPGRWPAPPTPEAPPRSPISASRLASWVTTKWTCSYLRQFLLSTRQRINLRSVLYCLRPRRHLRICDKDHGAVIGGLGPSD